MIEFSEEHKISNKKNGFLLERHCSRVRIGTRLRNLFFPAHSKNGIAVTVLTFPDNILGDPGADKGGEGKSKRAGKYIWNEEK